MTRETSPATRRVRISAVRVIEVQGAGLDLAWRCVPDGPYDPTPVSDWDRASPPLAAIIARCEGPTAVDFLAEPEVVELEGHHLHVLQLPPHRLMHGLIEPWSVWSHTPLPTDRAHVSERLLGCGATRAAAIADATTQVRAWKGGGRA